MDRAACHRAGVFAATTAGAALRIDDDAPVVHLRRFDQARLHADEALDLLIPRQAQRVVHDGAADLYLFRSNRLDSAHGTNQGA